jgi:hypothetical protein
VEIAPPALAAADENRAALRLLHAELPARPEEHDAEHGRQRRRRLHLRHEQRDRQRDAERF